MTTEEKSGTTQAASQANGFNSNAKDANNADKGGQDSENQDNAVEDDCIIGLDVTDVWEDDEKDKPRRRSWDRARAEKKRVSRERERERDNYRSRRRSRSRGRRSRSRGRRSRSNDKRREPSRRDPSKSNKDIEQDKLRAKKDNDSKILAEKEKAIKTLLDSDNVLPPGTETEAIQTIVEKNQQEQEIRNQEDRIRVSRDNKKRSPIHARLGPKKLSKSPIRLSPLRRERRSPFSPARRRRSNDRESIERRIASRRRLRDRAGRRSRSRSRDRRRSRSRSYERRRSRSGGRRSRSPFERRLRRRTLSRSRSPDRARRRSPFINELARQFSHEGILPDKPMGPGPLPPGYGAVPSMNPRIGILPTPGMPGPSMMNPMHPGVVHPVAPIMHSGPRGPPFLGYDGPPRPFEPPMNPGMGPAPVVDFPGPAPVVDFPGPPMFSQGLMNPVPPRTLRPVSPVPQPVPAPVIGQGYTAALGAPMQHLTANAVPGSRDRYSPNASYANRHSGSPGDKTFRNKSKREERMKTPEPPKPPIISEVKPSEKTSLSSLLEASVSSKDTSSATAPFKGFRQEIMRHCERALRSLPTEDPRLKMKGRFFFEPLKKDEKKEKSAAGSNSILLRKGRTEIYWDEEEDQAPNAGQPSALQQTIRRVATHQKYCQTEETTRESVAVQAEEAPKEMTDFSQQVAPLDLMPPASEETKRVPPPPALMMEDNRRVPSIEDIRRPIEDICRPLEDNRRAAVMEDTRRVAMEDSRRPIDRLDWSMRETYDHGADRLREKEDLRWTLSNSNSGGGVSGIGAIGSGPRMSERLPWSRGFSPKPIDHMHGNATVNNSMNDYMRSDRDMDMRDRDMDIRMDMRVLDMLRERERLMGAGGLVNRPAMLDDFTTRRQPVNDDFDMRKNYGGGSSSGGGGGPGSIGSFNRAMDIMDKSEHEPPQFGDSPIPDDPDDELEIIEERGTWPARNIATTTTAPFGNARGSAGGSGGGIGANVSRSFRGRLGGYRNY